MAVGAGGSAVGVVLVHGAFHGPWCWDLVVEGLAREPGIEVATPDLYTGPFPADPTVVQAEVDRLGARGPVIVCGHSFGGYPITALDPTTVAHLVYLAAFLPDREEWFPGLPVDTTFFDMVESHDDGTMTVRSDRAKELFYEDCTDEQTAWAIANLRPHSSEGAHGVMTRPAWREVPSTYVCCTHDATLTQQYMLGAIERVGDGVQWPTSHSPMISRADLVVDLVRSIAEGLRAA
jgi:pimeloyl-ACP methyl ester carboxylesterase